MCAFLLSNLAVFWAALTLLKNHLKHPSTLQLFERKTAAAKQSNQTNKQTLIILNAARYETQDFHNFIVKRYYVNQTGTGRDVFSGTKDDLRRKLLFKRGTGMFQML